MRISVGVIDAARVRSALPDGRRQSGDHPLNVMWSGISTDDAPTEDVEDRAAGHSAVLGGKIVAVRHLEACSLACVELERHEVAVARGVRAAIVLARGAAVLQTGRVQQACRAVDRDFHRVDADLAAQAASRPVRWRDRPR